MSTIEHDKHDEQNQHDQHADEHDLVDDAERVRQLHVGVRENGVQDVEVMAVARQLEHGGLDVASRRQRQSRVRVRQDVADRPFRHFWRETVTEFRPSI